MIAVFSAILVAYLLGAIPFGLLIARLYGVRDLRALGSGNIGATNVWRTIGPRAAGWVFALDIGKGVLAVWLAGQVVQYSVPADIFLVICAAAAVLGHIYSPYLSFHGGKGVNTGLGVMLMLLPREVVIALVVFLVIVLLTRFISLGSLAGSLALFVTVALERFAAHQPMPAVYFWLALLLTVMIFYTHRQNIRRLVAGTEPRFAWSASNGRKQDA